MIMKAEGIKALICPQCGAPVKIRSSKCEYCEAEFLVTSLAYVDKFDQAGISKYINHYKQLLRDNPDDGEINCAMGICYLDLGLHDLAIKYLAKAVEEMPDNGDSYYYYALALLKGKRPKVLTLAEIRKIEENLNAATKIDDTKSKYYYLWALVKHDFYIRNGLKVPPPTFEELIVSGNGRPYSETEVETMLQRIPIDDHYLIDILQGSSGKSAL